MNVCTTAAKGNKVLKTPKRDESFFKSHSVHLHHCSFYTRYHSKLPFHMHIFQFISKQLVQYFSFGYPAGRPGKGRRIPVVLLSAGMLTLSITYRAHYKAKEKQPDVHIKSKWGASALTDTSNFPGTSRDKAGQINGSVQVHSYRRESSRSQLMMFTQGT